MYAYVPKLIIVNKHTGESEESDYGIWFKDFGECTDYFLGLNYRLDSLEHSSPENEYYEIARFTADSKTHDEMLTICINKYKSVSTSSERNERKYIASV